MTIASVSARLLPLTESPTITASSQQLFLEAGSERLPLSARAEANVATLTGLTPSRLQSLAEAGGVQVPDLLRGTRIDSLAISVHQGEVIAIGDRLPKAIDADQIMEFIDQGRYKVVDPLVADGRLHATTLTSDDLLIGGEAHRFGHAVEIDLAGYALPQMRHFVERLICANGATIAVSVSNRRIPQFDVDGGVNARTLTDHVQAWSRQGTPDGVVRRLDAASKTAASLAEVLSLQHITRAPDLAGLRISSGSDTRLVETRADPAFAEMLGSYQSRLGVASLSEIPRRDLAFLPSETSVAGLVNLATEITSHFIPHRQGARVTAWWNHLLGGRYDLEELGHQGRSLPARWIPHHQAPLPN